MARKTNQKSGPAGLIDQVTGLVGKRSGRTARKGDGLAAKASGFVAGFLSGDADRKRRGGRGRSRGSGRR